MLKKLGQVSAHGRLVKTTGEVDILRHVARRQLIQHLLMPPYIILLLVLGHVAADIVAGRHLGGKYGGAVVASPGVVEVFRHIIGDAAPKQGAIDARLAIDLGHVTRLAKRVGHIAHIHVGANLLAAAHTVGKVADDALARDDHLVGLGVPRSDNQAAIGN